MIYVKITKGGNNMSENIIYCFSGSGNCLEMAKNIAKELGDTDIVMMRSFPEITDATSYKRVGFIFSCTGGGLPGNVEGYVRSIRISRDAYKFGVVQYAGYMGCGLHKIDSIVGLDYWGGVSNHCTAIWLMPHYLTIPPTTVKGAQRRAAKAAKKIGADVKAMKKSPKKPPRNLINQAESAGFATINKLLNKMMTVSDDCIGCGTCASVCPNLNIKLCDGKAVIGTHCIGCMACVQFCPKKAVNVGKLTVKRARYRNPNVSAIELCKKVIHID